MFFIIHLEVLLELVIDQCLEQLLVLLRDKSIMEHTHNFVTPKFDDLFLAFIEFLACLVNTLEDLGDITHVENVVSLCWGRQEVLSNLVVKLNGGCGKSLTESLDFIIEVLEFGLADSFIDLLHVALRGNGVVDHVELGKKTLGDL